MKVTIDADLCTGHGRCYVLAPQVFDSDDGGHGVVLISDELPEDLEVAARGARDNCPEGAITCT
jgi:ferredoxin